MSKLFGLLSLLKSLYVGAPPTSPAGTANVADRNGALRTAGIIFVLAGSAAALTYLSASSAVLGIGVAGATLLGYAAEYVRRKWKDYQVGLPTLEETDPSLPLNVFEDAPCLCDCPGCCRLRTAQVVEPQRLGRTEIDSPTYRLDG